MPRILLLTSASGAGHNSVAQTLSRALSAKYGESVEVKLMDPFRGPDARSRMVRLYGPTIVRAPWLWGAVYHATNSRRCFPAIAWPLVGVMASLLEEQTPDLVVSVHPLCHGAALLALRQLSMRVPVAVVITDLLDIHAAWQVPGVSLFLTPTAGAAQQLLDGGCASNSVSDPGMPLPDEFRNGSAHNGDLRRRLDLEYDRPVVLVTGGGEGAGPIERSVRTILRTIPEAQLVVVCGNNSGLMRRLSARGFSGHVLGFVDNMADWMHACDVVVAKAGALTVSEAAAARRPLLVMDALPGQEQGNLRFVMEAGIGAYAPPGRPLSRALRALQAAEFRPDSWLVNMARVDRPQASDRASTLLLERIMGSG